jgi:homoserine O-acetyltransferase
LPEGGGDRKIFRSFRLGRRRRVSFRQLIDDPTSPVSVAQQGILMKKTFRAKLCRVVVRAAMVAVLTSGQVRGQTYADASNVAAASTDLDASRIPKHEDFWIENYRFRDGELLPRLRLHYATLGTPRRNQAGEIDNAVLVLHWTGSDSSVLLKPNFINALYAAGRPLDASRYFLIFPDAVGHGKSSRPSDGLRADFPHYRYSDIVDLQHLLVTEHLGVNHLRAILGLSMGGMNAWQWAEAYPDAMDGIMPVVSLPTKVSGRNLLWRRLVIDMIKSDPNWNHGNYTEPTLGWVEGLQIARMMINGVPHLQAIITDQSSAEAYLAEVKKAALAIDANNQLYSLESSSDYDPEPNISTIKTKVFALNFGDDEFNPQELRILDQLIPKVKNGRFFVQEGTADSYGHLTMAFPELWADHVSEFMESIGKNSDTANRVR